MVLDIAARSTQAIDDSRIDALEVAGGRDVLLLHCAEPQELSTRFAVTGDSQEGLEIRRVVAVFVHAGASLRCACQFRDRVIPRSKPS
jgi:hypothetical protein